MLFYIYLTLQEGRFIYSSSDGSNKFDPYIANPLPPKGEGVWFLRLDLPGFWLGW
jgi:hypothetical protein